MALSDAAWIGSSIVALGAIGSQVYSERNSRKKDEDKRVAERAAFLADRQLELMREGFLSLMNVCGSLIVGINAGIGHPLTTMKAYAAIRDQMNQSGGYVDAYGTDESRTALQGLREVLATAGSVEHGMTDMAATLGRIGPGTSSENADSLRQEADDIVWSALSSIQIHEEQWLSALTALVDALRADLHKAL